MKKFLSILMTVILVLTCFSFVFASDIPTVGEAKLSSGGKDFVSGILGTVRWIGYAIAIGWLMYLGIKYVMASADEKASLKGGMIKYVIGAVLIIGAAAIFGWIADSGITG